MCCVPEGCSWNSGNVSVNINRLAVVMERCWSVVVGVVIERWAGFFTRVKWPEHEVDHSFLCSAKVRNEAIVCTPIRLCGTTFNCVINVHYSPTNAQVIVLQTILKFTLKQLRYVSMQSHHLQGAHYPCLLKLHVVKIVNYGTSVCDNKECLCITPTVEHSYISPSSTVGVQLYVY